MFWRQCLCCSLPLPQLQAVICSQPLSLPLHTYHSPACGVGVRDHVLTYQVTPSAARQEVNLDLDHIQLLHTHEYR